MKANSLVKALSSQFGYIFCDDIKSIISYINQCLKKEPILKNCFATIFSVESEINLAIIVPDKFYEKTEIFIPKYQIFSLYVIGLLEKVLKEKELSLANFQNILIINPHFTICIPIKIIYTFPFLIKKPKYLSPEFFSEIKLLDRYENVALANFLTEVEKTKVSTFFIIPQKFPKECKKLIIICGKKHFKKVMDFIKKIKFGSLIILKSPNEKYLKITFIY